MISFSGAELGALSADLRAAGAMATVKASDAVGDAAEATRDAAQSFAPKLTGALADSIHVEGSGLEREVTTGVPYAIYVAFGTYKDSPQPFMAPAASVADKSLVEAIEAVADDTLS